MAKIKIRKIIRDLDIDDYYGTGESQIMKVWVNPPRYLRDQHNDNIIRSREITEAIAKLEGDESKSKMKALAESMIEIGNEILSYWSTIWSQGKDKSTHWSVEDVKQLQKDCNDNDPGLWQFIATMSIGLMNDYINLASKKGKRR